MRFFRQRLLYVMLLTLIISLADTDRKLLAQVSILAKLLDISESVVEVHAKSDSAVASPSTPYLDPNTGRVVAVRKLRPFRVSNQGAGIIIHPDGLVATNAHITEKKRNIAVKLHDGTELGASILGVWPEADLAFLKIESPQLLKAVSFADSDQVQLGNRVYTIGQSQYTKNSVSEGVVKGIGALQSKFPDDPVKNDVLQITFNVYRGDSGTPLLDQRGGLIGMMTARLAQSNRMSYAIASNIIRKHYDELRGQVP